MNIVIVGAGKIGRYIASLLSKEEHNVILIDLNGALLENVLADLDVAVKKGSGTDWILLDSLLELSPLLIALTGNDETNLVSCALAKHLGYPRTIARVKDSRFLNQTRLDFARIFDVDYFINVELLVANDIYTYMLNSGSIAIHNFAHGAVQMRTLIVPDEWPQEEIPLRDLKIPKGIIFALIRSSFDEYGKKNKEEKRRTYIPHGADRIFPGDEVTVIGETPVISEIHNYFGIEQEEIYSAVIVGGSTVSFNLAKILRSHDIDVRILEENYETCKFLSEHLPDCTIINHDGTDYNFLLSEKIGRVDAFIAAAENDERNALIAMLGKQAGCKEVVAVIANDTYKQLMEKMHVNFVISPWLPSADHILSIVPSGKISSLISLYNHEYEIVEVNVSTDSKIVGIPLSELGPYLPKDFLIAVIQNRGRIFIAHGNRIISPGDTVIVVTRSQRFQELEKIF